jgi:hypothetical protein
MQKNVFRMIHFLVLVLASFAFGFTTDLSRTGAVQVAIDPGVPMPPPIPPLAVQSADNPGVPMPPPIPPSVVLLAEDPGVPMPPPIPPSSVV